MFRGTLEVQKVRIGIEIRRSGIFKREKVELELISQLNSKGTVCLISSEPCRWSVRFTTVPFTLLTEGR